MATDPRASIRQRDLERFRDAALMLAEEARRQLRALYVGDFEVKRKPDGSYVTSADFQVEQRLRAMIEREFPDHGIVGEEFSARAPQAEFQWILDPVDGTEEFVQRIPTFGTIIGLHCRGEPLVGVIDIPMLENRMHATFGLGSFAGDVRIRLADLAPQVPATHIRLMLAARANFTRHSEDGARFDAVTRAYPNHRIYATCYAHACVVRGQADAMVEYGNRVWDLAATRILVEEAGGIYRQIQNLRTEKGQILGAAFGKPAVVNQLMSVLGAMPGPLVIA